MLLANAQDIKGCVFDAYGTLLDFSSAVAREKGGLGDKADQLDRLWRTKQIEYTWLRSLMQRHEDFWRVTSDALDYSMEAVGISDVDLRHRLLEAYRSLDAFPEVPAMLERLRRSDLKLAILSNGAPEMLHAGVESAGIGRLLDAVLSVEEVGLFKPRPEVYLLATRRLGLAARDILFLSSNAWDAHGAATFGFRVVWVNRRAAPRERLPGEFETTLKDLSGLPELIGR